MSTTAEQLRQKSWTRGSHLISCDPSFIPIPQLIAAFDSDAFYWANALPEHLMIEMVHNSLCFGLYENSVVGGGDDGQPRQLVGFARCVTDFTTYSYLTDVWVAPALQGRGLGRWLLACVREATEAIPYLRRSVLYTGDWERSVPMYRHVLGMELFMPEEGRSLALMERKGPGHPLYRCQGNGYTRHG